MMLDPANAFYNDMPEEERRHWVSELLCCPSTPQLDPITQAAYLHHPVTYLYCEDDQGIPIALQEMMVGKVRESTGIEIRKERCHAGHSPFLSQPETVLAVAKRAIT
jgi:pimeloyl-ACP methyl ester carboxylesterase